MEANGRNSKVDGVFAGLTDWQDEMTRLRALVLDCGLSEELKWGQPCYTLGKANIVLIHGFKEYCALLFFKGALMQDAEGILIRQTENVQAGRQIRFTGVDEIDRMENLLKSYIADAVAVERAGLKVKHKETREFAVPEELESRMNDVPALKTAFDGLTPGRQRAYLLYFSSAKQARTREARITKYLPHILGGKGLDD